jgi:CheY-like chemotaxis protein/HPt (histidine-containing phosphotransfer) domain-containing protein
MVRMSADALLTLLNDILDLSKIEAGRLDFEPVPFRVIEVVVGSVKALAIRANEKGLSLTYEVAPSVPDTVIGDPLRVRQVLMNLVSNAIKFTDNGVVAVRVVVESQDPARDDIVLRMSVKDDGVGIPKDKQKIIFDAFAQADGSTTRKYGGTGLGLAISRRLVEMMGGEIGVESEEGKGATFHFTARFGTSDARASDVGTMLRTGSQPVLLAYEDVTAAPPVALRPLSILVAEDNAVNRMLITRLLEGEGHRPTLVTNGREALDAVTSGEAFDVVLMDIQMPEMDGLEVARRIREREREVGGHLPLIAVTAHAMQRDRDRSLAAGYDGYVTKPIVLADLMAAIRAVLPPTTMTGATGEWSTLAPMLTGFDEAPALERAGGDRDLVRELVELFTAEAPVWLDDLDAAVRKGDGLATSRVAHTIKGAVDTCGVRGGFDAAHAVERFAKREPFAAAEAAQRAARLRVVIEAALPAMRAFLGEAK